MERALALPSGAPRAAVRPVLGRGPKGRKGMPGGPRSAGPTQSVVSRCPAGCWFSVRCVLFVVSVWVVSVLRLGSGRVVAGPLADPAAMPRRLHRGPAIARSGASLLVPAFGAWLPSCLARLRPASALRQHAMFSFSRLLVWLARRVLCSGNSVFAAMFVRCPAGKPLLSIAGVVLERPKLRPRLS